MDNPEQSSLQDIYDTFENCKFLMEQTQNAQQDTLENLNNQSAVLEQIKDKYQEIDNKIKQTEELKIQWMTFMALLQRYVQMIRNCIQYLVNTKEEECPFEYQWQIYDENLQDINIQLLNSQTDINDQKNEETITQYIHTSIPQTMRCNKDVKIHETDDLIDQLIERAEVLNYLSENIKNKLQQDQNQQKCIDFSYARYLNLRHLE